MARETSRAVYPLFCPKCGARVLVHDKESTIYGCGSELVHRPEGSIPALFRTDKCHALEGYRVSVRSESYGS